MIRNRPPTRNDDDICPLGFQLINNSLYRLHSCLFRVSQGFAMGKGKKSIFSGLHFAPLDD